MSYYIGLSILSNNPADRQKLLSAEARRMLSRLEGCPLSEDDIATEEQGRPFFPDRQADFSISHSGALAAVSLVRGGNPRTGCDVERVRPRAGIKGIAEEFFSVHERDYVFCQDRFDETRFFQIWTLKECFLKLKGLSISDISGVPPFIRGEGPGRGHFAFYTDGSSPLSFDLYELSDDSGERYMLAAAIEGPRPERPEIRWFSQLSLSCKSIANIKAAHSPDETVSPKM